MKKTIQHKKGFAMVDLILAIAIVVVIAAISYVFLSDWRVDARDAKRRSDLTKIKAALVAYAQANNQTYPTTANANTAEPLGPASTTTVHQQLVTKYLAQMPVSPVDTSEYAYNYISNNTSTETPGNLFALLAHLEGSDATMVYVVNSDGFSGAVRRGSSPATYSGYSCGRGAGKNVCIKNVP